MEFAEKLKRRRLYSHVRSGEADLTLPDYLAALFPRFDRAGWELEIRRGRVTVNDRPAETALRLREHDCVSYYPEDRPEPEAVLAVRTLYCDDDLVVLDKPGNLCVHPTGPFFRNTLWHLAGERYGELHFVTRLDRETSGAVLAARNREVAAWLSAPGFTIRKEYLALVIGKFPENLTARGVLVPDSASSVPKKRRFLPDAPAGAGEYAETEFRRERFVAPDMSLVRAVLHTGRQHQIRATLVSLGFPVVGDKLYGVDETLYEKIRARTLTAEDLGRLRMERQALHAARVEFCHPVTGERVCCEAPCPFGGAG